MNDPEFPCTFCGCCCSHVDMAIENARKSPHPVWNNSAETFPFSYDINGKCEKLINNKCSVYEDRPLLCNLKKLGELLELDTKTWYYMVSKSCNQLMDQENVPDEYRINAENILTS